MELGRQKGVFNLSISFVLCVFFSQLLWVADRSESKLQLSPNHHSENWIEKSIQRVITEICLPEGKNYSSHKLAGTLSM